MIYKTKPLYYSNSHVAFISHVMYGEESKLENILKLNWGYKTPKIKKYKDLKLMTVKISLL